MVIIIVLLLVLNGFHLLSYLDRRQIHRDVLIQEPMLKARARNQVTLFRALDRAGLLTDEERQTIADNWQDAQFDQIER